MKKLGRTVSVIVVLILAHGSICFCEVTPAESSFVLTTWKPPFKMKLEPVSHPNGSGPVDLRFRVSPIINCDRATVLITSIDKLEYSGPMSWVAELTGDTTYSTVFQVVIPSNDTSSIEVKANVCGHWHRGYLCFVTTGDTVKVTPGDPRSYRPKPKPKSDEIIQDTLNEEQLQAKYEVLLDLRDSAYLMIAEEILGPIPESSKFRGHDGYYMLWISLENLFKLRDAEIDIEFKAPPPWSRKYQRLKDTTQPQSEDTMKPQGTLQKIKPTSPPGFSLEYVDGITPSGELPTGQEITFYIRIFNNTPGYYIGMNNGFRIYSPDGAQWGNMSADTLNLGWGDMFESIFQIGYWDVEGVDADTVGFTAFSFTGDGLPPYFDEVSYTITIGPLDESYAGKTICLDSSFYAVGGHWMWSSGVPYYPDWDGPHCFTIQLNTITFSGYLYYLDPVPPDTNQKPMRDVTIEMWDEDLPPVDPHDLLASTYTNDNGYFYLGPVDNEDGLLGGGLDVFFRIYAENQAAYVTESEGGDTIKMQTVVGNDLPGGDYDTVMVASLDSSGPFYIADVVLDGFDKWLSYRPGDIPPYLPVVLNSTVETGFDTVSKYVGINSSDNPQDWYPDTFDKDAILHEYGHWLSYAFDYFDISPGGTHAWWMIISPEFAATEAFGHLWSAVARSNVIQRNYCNDFYDYINVNVENGEYGFNGYVSGSANTLGKSNEGAVAGILWDIFDSQHDDYSGSVDWGVTTIPHHPDGIGDTLSDGIDNILTVLL